MPFQVDVSDSYDLLAAFRSVVNRETRGPWGNWVRETVDDLSVAQLRLWRHYRFAGAFVALIPTLPEPHGVRALLRGIGTMPISDFLRVALTTDYAAPDAPLTAADLGALSGDKLRARAFVDRYLRMTGHQRASVLRILASPEAARAEMVKVLEQFAHTVFAGIELELRDDRRQAADRLRQVASAGPEYWPAWLPSYADFEGFSPVVLAPSAFLGADVSVYYHEIRQPLFDDTEYEPFIITVGAQRALGPIPLSRSGRPVSTGRSAADAAERHAAAFAVLGDASRLRLVHLLAQRPRYGQELAEELGVSAATISHHVSILMKAGFLGVERRSHRTYFLLRHEVVEALLDESRSYAVGDATNRQSDRQESP